MKKLESKEIYRKRHAEEDPTERYLRKLSQPFEGIRHKTEAQLLASELYGDVLDCTVGTGRFIDEVDKKESYTGMDISEPFLNYVREQYPDLLLINYDLTKEFPFQEKEFDSLLCLRSLSAIGSLAHILSEMNRVLKPGGRIVIDYGNKAKNNKTSFGVIQTDTEDVRKALKSTGFTIKKVVYVDGLFSFLKRHYRIYKLTLLIYRFVPQNLWKMFDVLTSKLFWDRQLIVATKDE